MRMDRSKPVVAIIVLNYNSWQDTIDCVSLLLKQNLPDFMLIVVDNASSDGSVDKMKADRTSGSGIKYLAEYQKEEAERGGTAEKENELSKYGPRVKVVLIKNDKNLGYSAGNNVGIRYAIKKNADAVLIVNPDIRIEDPYTLKKMVETMFARNDVFLVGPNVVDTEGNRQSPLREPSFIEECLTPFFSAVLKSLGYKALNYLEPIRSDFPYEVKKVVGCCMLIRSSFLKESCLLDENVFLFCEEPILAAQVNRLGGKILFLPTATAIHLHKNSEKELYKQFINSRIYYLEKYKKYSIHKIATLKYLYGLINYVKSKKILK